MDANATPVEETRAKEWGLGLSVRGRFGRLAIVVATFWGVPASLLALFFQFARVSRDLGTIGLLVTDVGMVAGFAWFSWFAFALEAATSVRVGSRGISISARKFWNGRERVISWLEWGDIVLSPNRLGGRFSRTLIVSARLQPLLSWVLERTELRVILDHPDSRVSFHGISEPMAVRIGITMDRLHRESIPSGVRWDADASGTPVSPHPSVVGETWFDVTELPKSNEEWRRKKLSSLYLGVGMYGFTVAFVVYLLWSGGYLTDLVVLAGAVAILVAFGALYLWSYRRDSRKENMADLILKHSRIGSTERTFMLERGGSRMEVPWDRLSPPFLKSGAERWKYVLSYRTAEAKNRKLQLSAAQMAAVLRLPHRPLWDLPPGFQSALNADFVAVGWKFPEQ